MIDACAAGRIDGEIVLIVANNAGAAVLERLKTRLAKYKIPKSVVFTDALPRNPGGKILRHEVRAKFRT